MRIYISIPISNCDKFVQMDKAEEIEKKIKALGHEPVNPFDAPLARLDMSEKQKYAYYMGYDVEQLLMCDAIYFSPGWSDSKGCQAEHSLAEIYGLTRFYYFEDIPQGE